MMRKVNPRWAAMATMPTHSDSDQIDRLSSLPEALLVTILSFLPTHMAARTSVLSRRFRHLWEASPCLDLDSRQFTPPALDKFVAMADRALLRRDPSHPLLSLRIDFYVYLDITRSSAFILALFVQAHSLGLRHLAIEGSWYMDFTPILPAIFSMDTLLSLSLGLNRFPDDPPISRLSDFSFGITLTSLTSLSLGLNGNSKPNLAKLNEVLSRLPSLEDLQLMLVRMSGSLIISSQTIRNLKVMLEVAFPIQDDDAKFLYPDFPTLRYFELFLPALESLHFESDGEVPHFNKEIPLLRKAVLRLRYVFKSDFGAVAELLNYVSHVEELSIHVYESLDVESPIPILLEPGKVAPAFPNLKNLDATIHFHVHNVKAIVTVLANAPSLKSLELIRVDMKHKFIIPRRKKRDWKLKLPRRKKDWGLRLLRNGEVNQNYAYFRNLHLDENKKELMKVLSEISIYQGAKLRHIESTYKH